LFIYYDRKRALYYSSHSARSKVRSENSIGSYRFAVMNNWYYSTVALCMYNLKMIYRRY